MKTFERNNKPAVSDEHLRVQKLKPVSAEINVVNHCQDMPATMEAARQERKRERL